MQGIPTDTTKQLKTCTTCLRSLPVTDFRRRRTGTELRHAQCRNCFAEEHRARRRAKRDGRPYEYAKAIIDARRTRAQVFALTAELFRQFDGPQELAKIWKQAFEDASAAGRHLTAGKLLLAILELYKFTQDLQAEHSKDLDHLSDGDLEHLHRQQLEALRIQLVLSAQPAAQDMHEAAPH